MEEKIKKAEEDASETSTEIASTWNTSHEKLLASTGDRANGMRWMHNESHIYYEKLNFWLTVPNVAITALAGSASIGVTTVFPSNIQLVASLIIGIMTISSSVLTTINQYMKSSQLAESHRIACIAYGKLHRIISSELALRRDQRMTAQEFLDIVSEEQNRLEESSPTIQPHIVDKFNAKIKDKADLERPEIAGDLDHIVVNTAERQSSYDSTATKRTPYLKVSRIAPIRSPNANSSASSSSSD